MEPEPYLTWVSDGTDRVTEERALLALREFGAVRAELGTCRTLTPAGPVVFHGAQLEDGMIAAIRELRLRAPATTIFLHTPLRATSLSGDLGVKLLDPSEGVELLKARMRPFLATQDIPAQQETSWRASLVGESRPMQRVCEVVRLVGPRRCTVLISGETGTGKEIVAKAIHDAGPRLANRFVAINCSALPPALLESELFGHVRGAFTGAIQMRVGLFEQAAAGTLFLDEIGELPLELQAKLLRVLQEREIRRVGSSETVKLDVRVIAATNRDLRHCVREGTFREDLFYRLNVVPLELPPLRIRGNDIALLTQFFVKRLCEEERLPAKEVTREAWASLFAYSWPGNVRQLENVIASAIILTGIRRQLGPDDFHLEMDNAATAERSSAEIELPDHGIDFTETVNALERRLVMEALRKSHGNKTIAAEMLRLKRTTLAAKIRALDCESSLLSG